MIATMFRPRWILFKRSNSTSNWAIMDAARDPYNLSRNALFPDLSNAESTGESLDILSNGFKLHMTASWANVSGGTFIYAAFAETPTFNLYGGQSNAR